MGAGQLANNPLAWMFGEVAIDPPKHGNRVCLGNFVKGAGDLHALRHKASADSCFKLPYNFCKHCQSQAMCLRWQTLLTVL